MISLKKCDLQKNTTSNLLAVYHFIDLIFFFWVGWGWGWVQREIGKIRFHEEHQMPMDTTVPNSSAPPRLLVGNVRWWVTMLNVTQLACDTNGIAGWWMVVPHYYTESGCRIHTSSIVRHSHAFSRYNSHSQENFVTVFPSQNVVLTRCLCALPPCVYTHA